MYEIRIRDSQGQWQADLVGANNEFTSEAEAEEAIQLLRGLGRDWVANLDTGQPTEYRVFEV